MRQPIQLVHGNLVAARSLDDVWAGFRVACRSYEAEPLRRKASLVHDLTTFARVVQADFQLLRVTRQWDADAYAAGLREPPASHAGPWRRYVSEQRDALASVEAWQPSVWLFVRLADPDLDLHGRASRVFERTPREWWQRVRARGGVMAAGSLDVPWVRERASVAHSRVTSCLDSRPATWSEIQWLVRRAYCRALGEPPEAPPERFGSPYEEAQRSVIRWLAECAVDRQYRQLRAISELGESWQAGLALGEVGHARPFSHQVELMFSALEEHPWPVDASLAVRWIPNDQALRQSKRQFAKSSNQLEDEEQSAHGAMDDGYQRTALARELHGRLAESREPLLLGSLSLMCAAGSLEDLNRRVRHLREGFPWPLYRHFGDQMSAFFQHLPGQRPQIRGFDRPFTPEQIGAMVPHATHEAGSTGPRAYVIARTVSGNHPTLFDLREGSGTDKAPTVALVGSLGGGKTMFLQLLEYQAFLQNARIVDVDPKGDHRFHLLPEVAPRARTIVLGPEPEHRGKLDPLRVAPVSERHDAAATFLIDVLPPVDAATQAAISGAVGRVLAQHGDRACCMEVVCSLERGEREDERHAGYLLRQYADSGLARLGFASLSDPLPSRASEQVTYLQIRALKRAEIKTVRSEMTQSQRHGRAVLQLVALYAMRILGEDRDRLKVLAFDEASFLAEDAVGRQLLDTLARWGRSELAVPILSTQLLADVADQDNLIGHWFKFAMRSREHAARSLANLDLDDKGPLVDAMTERYGRGRCLYRDLRGRCEEIQTMLGPRLLEALSTTPVDCEEPEPIRALVAS